MSSRLFAPLLSTLALLGLPTAAFAHMVQTDYALDLFSSELQLTTTFSTGEPVQEAIVTIYAPGNDETPWLETTTNADGSSAFVPDVKQPGEWKVRIQQEGHEDILYVPVSEAGVEFNQISQGDRRDVHYASFGTGSSVWTDGLLGLYVLGTGAIVAWDYARRRQS